MPYPFLPEPLSEAEYRLNALWERFKVGLDDETVTCSSERAVVQEWRRCQEFGVVPEKVPENMFLPADEFQTILESERHLIEAAVPILTTVLGTVSQPAGFFLADKTGVILKRVAHPAILAELNSESGLEGLQSHERVVGNNAVGTALHYRATVHVHGRQHFLTATQTWSSVGTPITDSATGEILGVIAATTFGEAFSRHLIQICTFAACQASMELNLLLKAQRLQVLEHSLAQAARYPKDMVMSVDQFGHVLYASPAAQQTFGRSDLDESVLKTHGFAYHKCSVLAEDGHAIGSSYVIKRTNERRSFAVSAPEQTRQFGDFRTADSALAAQLATAARAAGSDLPILLSGETGTGKDVVARYLHNCSGRAQGPFVAVNCGAISRELFSASFFGYDGGAFTGADPAGRKGFLENAHNGTLFLDEIADLPPDIQVGLLRALETRQFYRVGGKREIVSDFRLIAASNADLEEAVSNGAFRADLYFRLRGLHVHLPPLRERPADLAMLIEHFLNTACARQQTAKTLSPEASLALRSYRWPGNVRELKNIIEAAVICSGASIELADLPSFLHPAGAPRAQTDSNPVEQDLPSLREQEHRLIISAMQRYQSTAKVAAVLGISRSTLYRKLNNYGLVNTS